MVGLDLSRAEEEGQREAILYGLMKRGYNANEGFATSILIGIVFMLLMPVGSMDISYISED